MKTDKEIKDWIDKQDVLTRADLRRFMYPTLGYNRIGTKSKPRFNKFWDYVLSTKDWEKLREYKESRISFGGKSNLDKDKFNKYKKAFESDIRIREAGKRLSQKLLEQHFSLKIGTSTIQRYKKCLQKDS